MHIFLKAVASHSHDCISKPIYPCDGEPLITWGFIYSATTAGWTATALTNRSARCYRQRKKKRSPQSPWYSSSGNGREVARKQRGSTQSSSRFGMLLQVIMAALTSQPRLVSVRMPVASWKRRHQPRVVTSFEQEVGPASNNLDLLALS